MSVPLVFPVFGISPSFSKISVSVESSEDPLVVFVSFLGKVPEEIKD